MPEVYGFTVKVHELPPAVEMGGPDWAMTITFPTAGVPDERAAERALQHGLAGVKSDILRARESIRAAGAMEILNVRAYAEIAGRQFWAMMAVSFYLLEDDPASGARIILQEILAKGRAAAYDLVSGMVRAGWLPPMTRATWPVEPPSGRDWPKSGELKL